MNPICDRLHLIAYMIRNVMFINHQYDIICQYKPIVKVIFFNGNL